MKNGQRPLPQPAPHRAAPLLRRWTHPPTMSSRHQTEGGLQMQHASTLSTRNSSAAARILLTAGIAAGPVYVAVALVEAFTRSGFDLTRPSLSLLTNGDLVSRH